MNWILLTRNDREERAGWTQSVDHGYEISMGKIGQQSYFHLIHEHNCFGELIWIFACNCNYSCFRRQLKTRLGKWRTVRDTQRMEKATQVKSKRSFIYIYINYMVMNHKFSAYSCCQDDVFLKRFIPVPARKWHKSAHAKLHAQDILLKPEPLVFTPPFIRQLMAEFGMSKLREQMLRQNLIAICKYAEGGKGKAIERNKS